MYAYTHTHTSYVHTTYRTSKLPNKMSEMSRTHQLRKDVVVFFLGKLEECCCCCCCFGVPSLSHALAPLCCAEPCSVSPFNTFYRINHNRSTCKQIITHKFNCFPQTKMCVVVNCLCVCVLLLYDLRRILRTHTHHRPNEKLENTF